VDIAEMGAIQHGRAGRQRAGVSTCDLLVHVMHPRLFIAAGKSVGRRGKQ
jgi:hypothetical protein